MQTSNIKLDSQLETRLKEELAIVLTELKKPDLMLEFLSAFLSETELLVFAKRLAILQRLHENYSYEQIQKDLAVSSATISSVAQIKDSSISEKAIEALDVHTWAEETADKIRVWLNRS